MLARVAEAGADRNGMERRKERSGIPECNEENGSSMPQALAVKQLMPCTAERVAGRLGLFRRRLVIV